MSKTYSCVGKPDDTIEDVFIHLMKSHMPSNLVKQYIDIISTFEIKKGEWKLDSYNFHCFLPAGLLLGLRFKLEKYPTIIVLLEIYNYNIPSTKNLKDPIYEFIIEEVIENSDMPRIHWHSEGVKIVKELQKRLNEEYKIATSKLRKSYS